MYEKALDNCGQALSNMTKIVKVFFLGRNAGVAQRKIVGEGEQRLLFK